MIQRLKRIVTFPVRFGRWFRKERPWRWRPRAYVLRQYQWRLGGSPYMGWSNDGYMDFDDAGLELYFGPWTLRLVIADND